MKLFITAVHAAYEEAFEALSVEDLLAGKVDEISRSILQWAKRKREWFTLNDVDLEYPDYARKTIRKRLLRLIDWGIIEYEGNTRSRRYRWNSPIRHIIERTTQLKRVASGLKENESKIHKMLPYLVDKNIVLSWMQIGELTSVLERRGLEAFHPATRIQENVKIITPELVDFQMGGHLQAIARTNNNKKFSLMDGIILSCARRNNIPLLSFNSDMRGMVGVIWLS
jgi:predicted nucleic acid-binding protein